MPTRGCCSDGRVAPSAVITVQGSRAVARCVETVSGVSRRIWLSADGAVLRKTNVSGMTENRGLLLVDGRMAP